VKNIYFSGLKAGAAPIAVALALCSGHAYAQGGAVDCNANPGDPACASPEATDTGGSKNPIVVTGTILRTTTEGANPVSTINATNLETRGETTVEQAIQNLSANGAGNLPNSFTAQGAFASGASAVSLRGLLTSSTLVLFDGLRAAYYPLADDGTRNFVDLNTIPDAIVDRVEVLKDGASSTYGADAVAGVVNIITKKQITGLHVNGEYGQAERGYGDTYLFEATYGWGDLAEQGFNIYASGRYYKEDAIYNRELRSPYNTGKGVVCTKDGSDCINNSNGLYLLGREFNGDWEGLVFTSLYDGFLTAPYSNVGGAPGTRQAGYRDLMANTICPSGATQLTPAERGTLIAQDHICNYDLYNEYGVVQGDSSRINGTIHATVDFNDHLEGYIQGNWARSTVSFPFYGTSVIRGSAPAETGVTFTPSPLYLPIYICPGATYDADGSTFGQAWNNGCNQQNGTLNPNNPFAAQGQYARVAGALPDLHEFNRYKTNAYRFAAGLSGNFADSWFYHIDATAMKVDLNITQKGDMYLSHWLQAVADGSYNFVNPASNSQELLDFIAPPIHHTDTSEMYQVKATLNHDLLELAGGPLQAGVGVEWRNERVNAPGLDSDHTSDPNLVQALERYSSRVNPFGVIGHRNVYSVFGELDAPFADWVDLNLSGRYDRYSTGQSHFSPKAALTISPVKQIKLRGTYSKGFRIGSFAEFGASPTTGYISPATSSVPQNIQDQYKAANGGTLPAYLTSYALGLTQVGNPNLKPEKSESYTIGAVIQPIRNLSFTVDYYHIKKTDLITGADYTQALAAYYAGQPIPAGFQVIPDIPAGTPGTQNLIPRAGFVVYSFTNKDSGLSEGIDFSADFNMPITDGIKFSSNVEATYVMELSQTVDGVKQQYQGTIGPYVITSASGTPQWRGSWQNTVDFGRGYVSLTGYYTAGYKTTAEDVNGAGTRNDCSTSMAGTLYLSGEPFQCKVKSFTYFNLAAGYDVTDNFQVYMNVNNLFDAKAPIDAATYGGYLYNPSWATAGAIGRFYKVGIKANF
jgi:iron complex outermembrane receptor protein